VVTHLSLYQVLYQRATPIVPVVPTIVAGMGWLGLRSYGAMVFGAMSKTVKASLVYTSGSRLKSVRSSRPDPRAREPRTQQELLLSLKI
jgi:hypothetical protein